ncbi:MAG: DUF2062 domain-containing protein [Hydrogenophaga sp.]|uniref:DUF2062 domain-containing protein n=1 Tax=Hydrogenophaga sp. TaxID=1904254 RepID=UPI0027261ADC|nr:DUF2062 domain-containing protein [Hydrogenophaga sp.]MDO9148354.1 DUF2062 domain-containing protein [Hydrogenophaga sp.]MDO9605094.1 DUF2062 domain-containing protein [Hydrogenophaga sp.]MDP2165281.1 DUF2062 domain-containing protein [Hydrogenophaga sp.]MDP3477247.1 DUF2062 domain-containing protein [Hydrogenophaga sp.]
MKHKFKQLLPTPETLRNNRWLRWMGPVLHHPRLWHFSRKGIALGLALGIFFGLLIPVAQIPFSATVAVLLRANLPMAVASTLVTNPVTFGPVYYGAYRLGKWVLGEEEVSENKAVKILEKAEALPAEKGSWTDRMRAWLTYLGTVGKPLVVGLAIVATVSGLFIYFLTSALWVLKTRWTRNRRLRERLLRNPSEADAGAD